MIDVNYTPEDRRIAMKLAEELGELPGTYEDGKGGIWHNYIGNLGEIGWQKKIFGAKATNTYDHDVYYKGATFEIKTKPRKHVPRPDYSCTVQRRNDRQNADYYGFVSLHSINNVFEKGYILGYMTTEQFRKTCRLNPAGTVRTNAVKPSMYDDWEVTVEELTPPEELFKWHWW